MTVEPDVVRRKLLEIGETTAHLRSWAPVTIEQLEKNQQLRWAVERGLQIAAEALFDTAAHILAAELAAESLGDRPETASRVGEQIAKMPPGGQGERRADAGTPFARSAERRTLASDPDPRRSLESAS